MKILAVPPSKVLNRFVSIQVLKPYFPAESVEELVLLLKELRRNGLISFDIRISHGYFEWQKKRADLKSSGDPLDGLDFGAFVYRDEFGINRILAGVDTKKPLNEFVAIDVITALPSGVADKYIEFRIHLLDMVKLKQLTPLNTKGKVFEDILYMGLKISNAQVSYNDRIISMPFQEREVLRMLMENPEALVFYDNFESRSDIVGKDVSTSSRTAASKLVSRVRIKLQKIVRQKCIYNVPGEGWKLKID
jgi:hypothetical protein